MTAAESLAAMDREKAYAIAYGGRFSNAHSMAWSDIASFCEETARMGLGENPRSFAAASLMDREYEGQFIPLIQAMVMWGVPA
jgi:hypothetical protein